MSVYIPGIFLPEQTDEAIIVFADGSVSLMSQDGFQEVRIPFDGIKAVEIKTPHGRLIDAEAIPFAQSEDGCLDDYAYRYDIINSPTIIEAEGSGEE